VDSGPPWDGALARCTPGSFSRREIWARRPLQPLGEKSFFWVFFPSLRPFLKDTHFFSKTCKCPFFRFFPFFRHYFFSIRVKKSRVRIARSSNPSKRTRDTLHNMDVPHTRIPPGHHLKGGAGGRARGASIWGVVYLHLAVLSAASKAFLKFDEKFCLKVLAAVAAKGKRARYLGCVFTKMNLAWTLRRAIRW